MVHAKVNFVLEDGNRNEKNKLRGLSPRADRRLSAKLVPTFADR
jgi:hypothetical protein